MNYMKHKCNIYIYIYNWPRPALIFCLFQVKVPDFSPSLKSIFWDRLLLFFNGFHDDDFFLPSVEDGEDRPEQHYPTTMMERRKCELWVVQWRSAVQCVQHNIDMIIIHTTIWHHVCTYVCDLLTRKQWILQRCRRILGRSSRLHQTVRSKETKQKRRHD